MGALVTVLKRSVKSFGTDRCATLSAAIAYRTVFALFPLALIGVSLLGFFVGDEEARQRVIDGITSVIPLGGDGEEALQRTLQGTSRVSGLIGLIGLLTAAWSASGLFGEVRQALNVVWDVDRTRPMLRAKAQDLLIMLGFGGLLAASTASTGVLRGAREAGAQWIGPLLDLADPVFNLLVFFAPLLLTFAAFMVLYRIAPHARLTWRDVWPAALIAALFFEFGKNLLTYYIANLGNFNALAGSLGAAILFLVFVYYASQIILMAAEIAKHRLLIRSGALPVSDPKQEKPSVSIADKAKGMVVGLWKHDEPHHDSDLPYEPGRLDPVTDRPTNTVEEVMVNWDQSRQQNDAAANGQRAAPDRQLTGERAAPSMTVIAGEARRLGTKLFIESEGKVTPIDAAPAARVTRNGKESTIQDVRAGDWVTIAVARDGSLLTLDATQGVKPAADSKKKGRAADQWMQAAGFVASLAGGVFTKARSKSKEQKQRHRPSQDKTILRRKPTQ
jgi:membrane protein